MGCTNRQREQKQIEVILADDIPYNEDTQEITYDVFVDGEKTGYLSYILKTSWAKEIFVNHLFPYCDAPQHLGTGLGLGGIASALSLIDLREQGIIEPDDPFFLFESESNSEDYFGFLSQVGLDDGASVQDGIEKLVSYSLSRGSYFDLVDF
jgi:hypothetical protein